MKKNYSIKWGRGSPARTENSKKLKEEQIMENLKMPSKYVEVSEVEMMTIDGGRRWKKRFKKWGNSIKKRLPKIEINIEATNK